MQGLIAAQNYHIYGEDAWRYAAFLASTLKEPTKVFVADSTQHALFEKHNAGKVVSSPQNMNTQRKDLEQLPSILVLNHTEPEQTMQFVEDISQPDICYVIQAGFDVDVMEGVVSVDADDVLLHNMHFIGSGFSDFVTKAYDIMGLRDKVATFEVNSEEQYNVAVDRDDIVWTHSEKFPEWMQGVPILRLRNGAVTKVLSEVG